MAGSLSPSAARTNRPIRNLLCLLGCDRLRGPHPEPGKIPLPVSPGAPGRVAGADYGARGDDGRRAGAAGVVRCPLGGEVWPILDDSPAAENRSPRRHGGTAVGLLPMPPTPRRAAVEKNPGYGAHEWLPPRSAPTDRRRPSAPLPGVGPCDGMAGAVCDIAGARRAGSPCIILPAAAEWHALSCVIHDTTILPAQPPTLAQAVRWTAELGTSVGRRPAALVSNPSLWEGEGRHVRPGRPSRLCWDGPG
jgi:hypothetical protein